MAALDFVRFEEIEINKYIKKDNICTSNVSIMFIGIILFEFLGRKLLIC